MKKLIALAVLLFSCTHSVDVAGPGGSSETQNGFVCTAQLPDGSPAAGSLVRVRPAGYFTGDTGGFVSNMTLLDTATDDYGKFTIETLELGEYYVEINDSHAHAGLIQFTAEADRGLQARTVTLLPYARVNGKVDSANPDFDYVRIRGLERIAPVSQDGSYSFYDLAEGVYTFQFISDKPQYRPLLIDSMSVKADRINIIGCTPTKTIVLNTTQTGANVSETVFQFPVLIRFEGEDLELLRESAVFFAKTDGTIFPHKTEYLDSLNGTAAVWVKVDTVKGNDTTLLHMHHGSESASFYSSREQVFDSDQFAGVWHLDELSNNEQDGYKDATSHGRNAAGINMGDATKHSGLIGLCQELNGVDGFIQIPGLLDQSFSLTLSAWINSNDSIGEIISIGDNVGIRYFSDGSGYGAYGYYSYRDENSWLPISARTEAPVSEWHHLSLVIDSAAGLISLYTDGVLQTQAVMTGKLLYNKIGTDTYIGQAFRETSNLQGLIDEVRVCNKPRSWAWLKLCFENQKSDQTLVNF